MILDEATANVDPENEDRLQKAIEALTRNKTILMIAHRLKTVRNADQILVLDDGQIVQRAPTASSWPRRACIKRSYPAVKSPASGSSERRKRPNHQEKGVPSPGTFRRRHSCCVREIALERVIDTSKRK